MNKRGIMLSVMAAMLAVTPAYAAEQDEFTVFGMASDFDPDQTAVGAGVSASWKWTETVFLTSQLFVSAADDVDRGQLLLGGEWRDRVGQFTGYVGLQVGMDAFDSAGGTSEDAFGRAYYDVGWPVLPNSELRLGVALDFKSDAMNRETGARIGWTTRINEGMTFVARVEAYEDEKNVFGGVSWGF